MSSMSSRGFLKKSKIEHSLYDDGIKIFGNGQFIGGEFDTYDDHRIAMSVAISSIIAKNKTVINDHEVASISYKNFYKQFFIFNKINYISIKKC